MGRRDSGKVRWNETYLHDLVFLRGAIFQAVGINLREISLAFFLGPASRALQSRGLLEFQSFRRRATSDRSTLRGFVPIVCNTNEINPLE